MAAGMMMAARLVLAASISVLVVGACASTQRPTVQADQVELPAPMRSYGNSVAAAVGRLEAAAAGVGSRLATTDRAYRPSEPESLLQVPRVLMRADLADPDDGFVVIYEASDGQAALSHAADLARYLGSGFGQSNFAADTRFSVAVVGETVVFTSLSPSRSTDPDRASEVFDALASVGQSVEVLR